MNRILDSCVHEVAFRYGLSSCSWEPVTEYVACNTLVDTLHGLGTELRKLKQPRHIAPHHSNLLRYMPTIKARAGQVASVAHFLYSSSLITTTMLIKVGDQR